MTEETNIPSENESSNSGENLWASLEPDSSDSSLHATSDVPPFVAPAPGEATDEGTTTQSHEETASGGPEWPRPTTPVVVAPAMAGGQKSGRTDWRPRVTLLLVAALVGALAGHFASSGSNGGTYSISTSNQAPTAALLTGNVTIPQLVDRVAPSIVTIDVKSPVEEDEGTGMILTSNGLILTNNHVIANSLNGGTISITRYGTTKAIPAILVGTDATDDVALIRAEGVSGLPTVTLGNSHKLVTGDSVVAIGNALGLSASTPTVTAGIVSALGREVTASEGSSSETLYNMIQTDAAINPGNSGGPLLDAAGQVIGMNTAVAGTLPDGTSAQNIGFAIPIAKIQSLIPSLLKGTVLQQKGRAYLGVEVTSNSSSAASANGLSISTGAIVDTVEPGTAAAAAGLQPLDVITKIDKSTINNALDVTKAIQSKKPGQTVTIHVNRFGQRLTLTATLGELPS